MLRQAASFYWVIVNLLHKYITLLKQGLQLASVQKSYSIFTRSYILYIMQPELNMYYITA